MKNSLASFWPYGMLALLVPAITVVTAYVLAWNWDESRSFDLWRLAAICFSLLGAGNAYLLATATGDLGRSMLALPLGALAGFAAVALVRLPFFSEIYTILLCAFIADYLFTQMVDELLFPRLILWGFAAVILALTVLFIALSKAPFERSPVALVLCYPILISAIGAGMPLEWTRWDVWESVQGGTYAALRGLLAGLGAGVSGLFVSQLLHGIAGRMGGLGIVFDGIGIALLAANYRCVTLMLSSGRRVGASLPAVDTMDAAGALPLKPDPR